MNEIDKIALIEIQDGKILSTRSKGKTTYYLPGGKREPGETDEQALIREIWEELQVSITPQSLTYVGTFQAQADGHQAGIMVKMTCYRAAFTGQLAPSHEIEEIRWLGMEDLTRVSAVDQIIFQHLKEAGELS